MTNTDFDFIRPSADELSSAEGPTSSTQEAPNLSESERREMEENGREQRDQDRRAERELDDKLRNSENIRILMKAYGEKAFTYLKWYSVYCGSVVILQGFSPKISIGHFFRLNGFSIDDTPLTVLVGSTAVSVIGLIAIMLRGLYGLKEEKPKPDDAPKKSDKKD